jgi:hypothetical protein
VGGQPFISTLSTMEFSQLAFLRLDYPPLKSSVYIGWAEQMLNDGCNAPSVAELASCAWDASPDPQQIERIFQSCVVELDLELPSDWYQALLSYACSICTKAIVGTLDSSECLSDMLTLADDHNEPYMLWIWIDLANDFSPYTRDGRTNIVFNTPLKLDNPNECILRTATQFIALCSMSLPEKFPLVWMCQECESISDESTFTTSVAHNCTSCASASSMKNMRFYQNREYFIGTFAQKVSKIGLTERSTGSRL